MNPTPLHLHYPLPKEIMRSRIVCEPEWEKFAGPNWSERIMELDLADRFHAKQGRSIVRWTLRHGPELLTVYLKRHYKLPRWSAFASRFLPFKNWSPGLQERENLQWAEKHAIPVPRVLAAGEFLGRNGKVQSFIAIEELAGMIALHEAIPLAESQLSASAFGHWKRGLFAELARLSHAFHDRGVYHKDWYLCHFYIPQDLCAMPPAKWYNRVFVIDFHRMKRHYLTGLWWRMKDLAQLDYSAIWPGVDEADRREFWQNYTAGMYRLHRAWLRLGVAWKSKIYQRNHRKAEARKRAA